MQITTCPPYDNAIRLSKARLEIGELIAYPTDTIYGIGCDALNSHAVKKIMHIKKREGQKPLSALFGNWEQARKYVHIDDFVLKNLKKLTPGPYTFLLELKTQIPVTSDSVLGCRIPDNEFCKRVCTEFENPIVTTSANISGGKSPSSVAEMEPAILKSVDLIIDEGPTVFKEGSTIIDVQNRKIVRKAAKFETAQKWLESL